MKRLVLLLALMLAATAAGLVSSRPPRRSVTRRPTMRRSLIVLVAALLAAVLGLACGQDEEATLKPTGSPAYTGSPIALVTTAPGESPTSAPTVTPGSSVTLYRWVNVTVLIPDGSGISAGPGPAAYSGLGRDFVVVKGDPNDSRIVSTVVIDGDDGAIVEEEVLDEHREEIDRVLATLTVGPFERSSAPWPYASELTPDLVRETQGRISWMRPPPSTGLYVGMGIADPGGPFVDLRNERSAAFASFNNAAGTLAFDTSSVVAEDLPVFERWLATVKQCGAEIKC